MNNKLRIIILCACVIFFITIASCSRFYKNENIEFVDKDNVQFKNKLNQQQYHNSEFITDEQQKQIKNALEKNINKYSAKGGAVIVMDADNSQVLSMTSAYEGHGIFNYIYDFKYEPAATYMPFIVAMGLENGIISDDTTFDISTPFNTKDKQTISSTDILAISSNIACSEISTDIDSDKQLKFLSALGFDKDISLGDIKIEKSILFQKNEKNISVNTPYIGFVSDVTHYISQLLMHL